MAFDDSTPLASDGGGLFSRFLLERSGLRGVHVRLDEAWRSIRGRSAYPDAVAGLLGAAAAELVVWQVATRALGMAASWHPALWWQWPLAGALLVSCIGYLRLHRTLAVPPARVLPLMASGE